MSHNVFETPALSTRSSMDDFTHHASGTQTPRSRASARLGRHKSSYIMDSLPPPSPSWSPVPSIHGGFMSGATTARTSRRNSLTSMHSMASHGVMEEIKHEAMVNFLFQQQCSKWSSTCVVSVSLTVDHRKALDQQRQWRPRGCSRTKIARQLRSMPSGTERFLARLLCIDAQSPGCDDDQLSRHSGVRAIHT